MIIAERFFVNQLTKRDIIMKVTEVSKFTGKAAADTVDAMAKELAAWVLSEAASHKGSGSFSVVVHSSQLGTDSAMVKRMLANPDFKSTFGKNLKSLGETYGHGVVGYVYDEVAECVTVSVRTGNAKKPVQAASSGKRKARRKGAPAPVAPVAPVATDETPTKEPSNQEVPEVPEAPKAPKIDPDYFYFDEDRKLRFEIAINASMNVWCVGESGTGKTEFVQRLLEGMKRSFVVTSFNGESCVDDLLGHYRIKGGDTEWVEGSLASAMKTGSVLVIDEVDAAPPEANLVLHRVLELRGGKPRSFFNVRNGEIVTAKEGFTILATSNTAGAGDFSGNFAGTQTQNQAFRDRFLFEYFDYPTKAIQRKILTIRTGANEAFIDQLTQFGALVRDGVNNGELATTVTMRSMLLMCEMHKRLVAANINLPHRIALDMGVLAKVVGTPDKAPFEELVNRVFG